jgi:hypothetical protein
VNGGGGGGGAAATGAVGTARERERELGSKEGGGGMRVKGRQGWVRAAGVVFYT